MSLDLIFTSIERVPWHGIKGQLQNCEHVPAALRALVSHDPETRGAAYWTLDNHIVVQGGLYEGSFYVLPFVVALVQKVEAEKKILLYDLLYEIANGASSINNAVRFARKHTGFEYFVPANTGVKTPIQIACRSYIAMNLRVFLKDVEQDDEELSFKAIELLTSFDEYYFTISTHLAGLNLAKFDERTKKLITEFLEENG